MGENSKIAWTDHTFNPWIGCARVSPGCEHCYAETQANFRKSWAVTWGIHGNRRIVAESTWKHPRKWHRDALRDGVRRRVFCASLADVFEDRPELVAPRARVLRLIEETPGLDWQLLTKRPENVMRLVPEAWRTGFPPNVWMGTTAENDDYLMKRAQHLRTLPARVLFLSCEPLLGPLPSLPFVLSRRWADAPPGVSRHIDWLIAGGESGAKARDLAVPWVRDIVKACAQTRVACFVKQLGDNPTNLSSDLPGDGLVQLRLRAHAGTDPLEWPEDLRVREFPVAA